jgi:RNA 2',3'-cyclic 3'-phosphodiesterase
VRSWTSGSSSSCSSPSSRDGGVRTFVAIDLDDAMRRSAVRVQERLQTGKWDVKWVEPENLHVTLRFLGEIDEAALAGVIAALERSAATIAPFEIAMRGLGWFPPRRPPRVVWAGIVEPTGRLHRLHESLEHELRSLGLGEDEERFHAHVTLGRVRTPKGVSELEQAIGATALEERSRTVDALVLRKSDLGPKGPRYEVLKNVLLTGN